MSTAAEKVTEVIEKTDAELAAENAVARGDAIGPEHHDPERDPPKADEPKAEEPKAEEPKAEEPKAEEPKAEEPKAEEPKADAPRIPKSRFDFKSREAAAAKARVAELEAELATARAAPPAPVQPPVADAPSDLDARYAALDVKVLQARKDDDVEAEMAASREYRALDREFYGQQVADAQAAAVTTATAHVDFDSVVDTVLADYPQLDRESGEGVFVEAESQRVVALMDDLQASGRYSQADALLQAVSLIYPEAPAAPVADPPKADESEAVRKARAEEAVRRGAADATKQPPEGGAAGLPSDSAGVLSDRIDVSKLSDAEFEALPGTTKARLRGDIM